MGGGDGDLGGGVEELGAPRFSMGVAPRDDPLTYPGARPSRSFVFTGATVELLEPAFGPGADDGGWWHRLDERLDALGAAPVRQRLAVLAYGSNASPAQLRSKFDGTAVSGVVPVLEARVSGLSVGYSAHVARYGSVPATLVVDERAEAETWVTYLDDDQLAIIDATEPGHDRVEVGGAANRVVLATGEAVESCRCYRSRRPILTFEGRPVRIGEIVSVGSDLPARTQLQLQTALLALWQSELGTFADARSFVDAVRSNAAARETVRRCLRELEFRPRAGFGVVDAGEIGSP